MAALRHTPISIDAIKQRLAQTFVEVFSLPEISTEG